MVANSTPNTIYQIAKKAKYYLRLPVVIGLLILIALLVKYKEEIKNYFMNYCVVNLLILDEETNMGIADVTVYNDSQTKVKPQKSDNHGHLHGMKILKHNLSQGADLRLVREGYEVKIEKITQDYLDNRGISGGYSVTVYMTKELPEVPEPTKEGPVTQPDENPDRPQPTQLKPPKPVDGMSRTSSRIPSGNIDNSTIFNNSYSSSWEYSPSNLFLGLNGNNKISTTRTLDLVNKKQISPNRFVGRYRDRHNLVHAIINGDSGLISKYYSHIGDFNEYNIAVFRDDSDHCGLINIDGNEISGLSNNALRYQDLQYLGAGYYAAAGRKERNKLGLINKNGKELLDFQFDAIHNFETNGVAKVLKNGKYGLLIAHPHKPGGEPKSLATKYSMIHDFDKSGYAVTELACNDVYNKASEAYICNALPKIKGMLNSSGELVFESLYSNIGKFNDYGLAVFSQPLSDVGEVEFEQLAASSNGLSYPANDLIVSKSGEILLSYEQLQPELNQMGYALYRFGNRFNIATEPYENLLRVDWTNVLLNKVLGCFLIDTDRNSFTYFEEVERTDIPKLLKVKKNGQWGLMNVKEKILLPAAFDSIVYMEGQAGIFKVTENSSRDYEIKLSIEYGYPVNIECLTNCRKLEKVIKRSK